VMLPQSSTTCEHESPQWSVGSTLTAGLQPNGQGFVMAKQATGKP
jgi:hypothetical protein